MGDELTSLPIEALSQLRQRADTEMDFMTTSSATLRKALLAFDQVKVAVSKVKDCKNDQDCLVPVGSTVSSLLYCYSCF